MDYNVGARIRKHGTLLFNDDVVYLHWKENQKNLGIANDWNDLWERQEICKARQKDAFISGQIKAIATTYNGDCLHPNKKDPLKFVRPSGLGTFVDPITVEFFNCNMSYYTVVEGPIQLPYNVPAYLRGDKTLTFSIDNGIARFEVDVHNKQMNLVWLS